jgi:hypothetical protein
VSLAAGQPDVNGNVLEGTELQNMVAFGGKLFAAIGIWEDTSPPASGPQIIALNSPTGKWQQDTSFPGHVRIDSLEPITFTTNASGVALPSSVTMLAASVDGALFTRGTNGTWTDVHLPGTLTVRAIGTHQDAFTHVDELFIGSGVPDGVTPGAIYTAVYDPTQPGSLRVAPTAEFTGYVNRVMAFVEVDGRLLFVAKPGLYERTDGFSPSWSEVANIPPVPDSVNNSGLRGLTVVGSNPPVVLAGLEGDAGLIYSFNPTTFAYTDFSIGTLLQQQWGLGLSQYIISAYNNMPQVTDSLVGGPVNLIGLQAHNPNLASSAWYLVRTVSGQYTLHQVTDLTALSPLGLVAVRTICLSPFAADQGQALYLGGYDANFMPAHNTAWLYRVGLQTALSSASIPASRSRRNLR